MCSSLLHLAPGSRDLTQTEEKLQLLQAEQLQNLTIIFNNTRQYFLSQTEIKHVIQQSSEES